MPAAIHLGRVKKVPRYPCIHVAAVLGNPPPARVRGDLRPSCRQVGRDVCVVRDHQDRPPRISLYWQARRRGTEQQSATARACWGALWTLGWLASALMRPEEKHHPVPMNDDTTVRGVGPSHLGPLEPAPLWASSLSPCGPSLHSFPCTSVRSSGSKPRPVARQAPASPLTGRGETRKLAS